jgi:hypothetical protein
MTAEIKWSPYQWVVSLDKCPHCYNSYITSKKSNYNMKEAIGAMIKAIKIHRGKYCNGIPKKELFKINVNIKWSDNKSSHAYKSTWEEHKIYV